MKRTWRRVLGLGHKVLTRRPRPVFKGGRTMEYIQSFLGNVKLGGKQNHLNMTLIPLLVPDAGTTDYMILEEALNEKAVEITEVSQGGNVP